jgi:hypothetical protein
MEPPKRAKISFCTTCKNRLWQLSHTMPSNLAIIEANGCSEMVLVNYNSQDELDVWIGQFRSAIEAGTLRYVHERSDPHFHVSKAKNLAHFAATGEFVVNLDADNFIGDTIARYRRFWRNDPDMIIRGWCGRPGDGTYGRIGMAKRHFVALGGYDEEMLTGAVEDWDLLRRAEASGFRFINLAQLGIAATRNDKAEQIRYSATAVSHGVMKKLNLTRSEESIRIGRLVANCERKPRPVLLNFSTELEL